MKPRTPALCLGALIVMSCSADNQTRTTHQGALRTLSVQDEPEPSLIPVDQSLSNLPEELHAAAKATGKLTVHPFADKNETLECTAIHLGDGLMLTAGHCFLGTLSCNGATVQFYDDGNQDFGHVSRCQTVWKNVADDSRYLGSHQDYALFSVSNPPAERLEIDADREATVQKPGTPVTVLSFPILQSSNETILHWSGPCTVLDMKRPDFLGRELSPHTLPHNCPTAGGSTGAALINLANGKVLALHSGGREIRLPQEVTRGENFAKIVPADIAEKPHSPTSISVGDFGFAAFPFGLPGNVNIQVAKLGTAKEIDKVSFKLEYGHQTKVYIRDGRRKTHSYTELLTTKDMGSMTFLAPVTIYAETGNEDRTLRVRLTDIQYIREKDQDLAQK